MAGNNTVISLEIHDTYIKLAQADISGQPPKFRFIKKTFQSENDDNIASEINSLLKELNLEQPEVFLNIPRHLVMTRCLNLPTTKDSELENMVNMESLRQIPYSDTDIITRYRIIKKSGEGYAAVLAAIAQKKMIERFIAIVRGAGAKIVKICLGTESLFGWYRYNESAIKESGISKEAPINIVNIDSDSVNIDVIEDGRIAFNRSFAYSSVEEAQHEIKKSIMAYSREKKNKLNNIIITGAKNKMAEFADKLKLMENCTVAIIDQAKNIIIDGPSRPEDIDDNSFAELTGICLKNDELEINLLTEELIEEKHISDVKKTMLK
jgi:Tfp pilus assembly PilM family ATPase